VTAFLNLKHVGKGTFSVRLVARTDSAAQGRKKQHLAQYTAHYGFATHS